MAQRFKVARSADETDVRVIFWCPGCDRLHQVQIKGPKAWQFDGNFDAPTFNPSILVRWNGGHPPREERCHSYVKAGIIEFLGDCSHALAGKSVAIPDLPEGFRDLPPEG